MRMIRIFLAVLMLTSLIPSLAPAETSRLRDMADSEFRIAQKAYRDAVSKYGDDVQGLPADEKSAACRKISQALYDNKVQVTMEDAIGEMVVRKQINQLTGYANKLGCQ